MLVLRSGETPRAAGWEKRFEKTPPIFPIRAQIDQDIDAIQAELSGKGTTVLQKESDPSAGIQKGRKRTPARRKAHSEAMRRYWAAKRAKAAKVTTVPQASPAASPKRRAKTAAEKKALSLKMKQIWKKRRAAAKKA
jgi:hypothetical protein